ncbi:hypothetical protein G7Y89_g12977 [Cudoniella acicularis]|uniref:Uncharacterized protein n=1 Tax=Cudoniella acicularis TaxID=354080 RepID=A0A8H4RAS7_9HELO|nr:hypothetical protein G7Y89_g12977 [Cudoniella acicularis]
MADNTNAPWRKYRYPASKFITDATTNKKEDLRDMLDRLNLASQDMKSTTFGGVFNSSANNSVSYDSFATRVPPDVPKNARILAFLAIGQNTALPDSDGWFLSDFLAFYHLFQGLTPHQSWLHALDLESLLKSCKRYLHGSPYSNKRKVVLNEKILKTIKDGKCHPFTRAPDISLWVKFQSLLREHISEASKNKQHLLVMIFGHGEKGTYNIAVSNQQGGLSVKRFLKKLDQAKDVPIMLLTTACYGGGWLTEQLINISGITAAGPNNMSASWRYSLEPGSLKRASGSMFVSAIVQKLTTNLETQQTIQEELEESSAEQSDKQIQEQEESYAEFLRTTYDTLFELDRRGYEHKFCFKAQDDGWSDNYHLRTGIPLFELKSRWESLEDWAAADPTLHPGDFLNRDPDVPENLRKEYLEFLAMHREEEGAKKGQNTGSDEAKGSVLGKRDASSLGKISLSFEIGGSFKSFQNFVAQAARIYLNSFPGPHDGGDNLALHGLLDSIIKPFPGENITYQMLESARAQLDYRLEIMDKAEKYVEHMGLREPLGQSCHEFNAEEYTCKHQHEKQWIEINENFYRHYSSTMFPKPTPVAGRPFYKGSDYVIAAMDCNVNDGRMSLNQCIEALNKLKSHINMEIHAAKEAVKDLPDIRSKRQRVAEAFGKTLRNLSPVRGSGSENRTSQSGPATSQVPRLQTGPQISPRKTQENRERH